MNRHSELAFGESGAPHRQLECGCWQARIRGDIVTDAADAWVTIAPCDEHKDQEQDDA